MNSRFPAALFIAIVLGSGCARTGRERSRSEILAADRAFSALSASEGPKAAFLGTIARDGKLLSETRVGPDAVEDELGGLPANVSLTWEPSYADVGASGDLGYTWGRYRLVVPSASPGKPDRVRTGTYATIWKRQPDGSWKIVLDGGNPDP